MKKVYQFTTDGKLVGEYRSLAEAGRTVGVTMKTISSVVNGKRNTAKGYIWSFKNELDVCLLEDSNLIWMPIKGFDDRYEISNTELMKKQKKNIENYIMKDKKE